VVDAVGVDQFAVCGYGQGGPVAIPYSLAHPEKVSHLILVNSFAVGSAYYRSIPAMRALKGISEMAEEQWDFFTLTLATAVTGFNDRERAQRTAELFRNAMLPAGFLSFVAAAEQIDLTDCLPLICVPTLVVEDGGFATGELCRDLATRIPGACFVSTDNYVEELHRFITGELPSSPLVTIRATTTGTAIILFADIADSTALTERLGDAAFREKARALDEALRRAITSNGGQAIEGKLLGDGVLATFGAAREAIGCAMAIHEAGSHAGLPLHVGVHAGDVIRESNNVFGGAVNIAARVAGEAGAGETLVSQTVRDLARTSAGVSFEDRGERELKGVGEPVRVWAVR
jgi:class 3 adenylate cyclase